MNDIKFARLLGLFGFALGAYELARGHETSRAFGLGKPRVLEAFGAREIATGLMLQMYPDRAWPVWARVAGDVADLAVLGLALGSGNPRRHNAARAALAVFGVTLADIAVAAALTRREQRALATARRTRIARRIPQPAPGQPNMIEPPL